MRWYASCVFANEPANKNGLVAKHKKSKAGFAPWALKPENQWNSQPREEGIFWDKVKLRDPRIREDHPSKFGADEFGGWWGWTRGQTERKTWRPHNVLLICVHANLQKHTVKIPLLLHLHKHLQKAICELCFCKATRRNGNNIFTYKK